MIIVSHCISHSSCMGNISAECEGFKLLTWLPIFLYHVPDEFTVLFIRELFYELMSLGYFISILNQLISDSIILERNNQSVDYRITKSQFIRNILVKQTEDIILIHSFRGRSYSKEEFRFEVLQYLLISLRCSMMTLIDDYVVKGVWFKQFK